MIKRRLLFLTGVLILLVGFLTTSNIPTHKVIFFDKDIFFKDAEKVKKENNKFTQHIYGGIVPHHLLPSDIIADFFNRLSSQGIKTIILIGPNHYEQGNFKALTSLYSWQTPFGNLDPNEMIIKDLIEDNLTSVDEKVLPADHAVSSIMPFIKYFLPEVKVVPILLSGFMSIDEVNLLSDRIKNYINDETIIIAAVDFSHFLPSTKAFEKDEVTFSAMKNFDYKKLLSLGNDYLDSPTSIIALLMVLQDLGKTNMELLHHTNSGEMQKNNYMETTSYFSIAYY